jgi:hypothetical protein
MSNNVFPNLPLVQTEVAVERFYRTTTHETVSGKEYRTSWGATPRRRYKLKGYARRDVNAPSPWSAYSEVGVLLKFLDDHRGSFDSFLFNDPEDGTQVRVRFATDNLRIIRYVAAAWEFEIELVSVI